MCACACICFVLFLVFFVSELEVCCIVLSYLVHRLD